MPFIYLACPYTSPDRNLQKHRLDKINRLTKLLVSCGLSVYSPLTSTVPLERMGLRMSSQDWIRHDRPLLEAADCLMVLTMPGWQESVGITLEIEFFRRVKKPVLFISEELDSSTLFGTGRQI